MLEVELTALELALLVVLLSARLELVLRVLELVLLVVLRTGPLMKLGREYK